MKSILLILMTCYSVLALGSVRELGTLCAVDCRYDVQTLRAPIVGKEQWVGNEQERYYKARVSAKMSCVATGGQVPSFAEPKPFSGYSGYICCALEKVDGALTPSRCPLLN